MVMEVYNYKNPDELAMHVNYFNFRNIEAISNMKCFKQNYLRCLYKPSLFNGNLVAGNFMK